MKLSIEAWEFSHKNEHNNPILLIETYFYRMRVSFMHEAPIPTLSSYFSLCLCVWLACAAGISLCILIRVYSKSPLMYLNFNFYSFSYPTVTYLNSNSS